MDAAATVNTAPAPIRPILRKLGVIPFGYGGPYQIDSNLWPMPLSSFSFRWQNCLLPGIATCYPRSVNRNIFYIIGVIVVIVIVLKVLHLF
jgi:hypothetical protein